jgi:hypothetical protein
MFVRKAALAALELWSDSQELVESLEDWIIDWRWLASRDEGRGTAEPSFTSEWALIH